jgi:phage FluMu protein Com
MWHIHVLVGKTEGSSLLGKPRCRWVNNIKIPTQEKFWVHLL